MFRYLSLLALAVSFASGVITPSLKADEWDKETIITVDQPIEVEGTVLATGKYVLRLFDSPSDRRIVQVFDADGRRLVTTVLANAAYRQEPTGDTQFSFYEASAGRPRVLRTWFYPGDTTGVEFRPPHDKSTAISESAGHGGS